MLTMLRRPPVLGNQLHNTVRNILLYGVIINCLVNVWVLGNNNILEDDPNVLDLITTGVSIDTSDHRGLFSLLSSWFSRANHYFTYMFVVVLALCITWIVLQMFLFEIINCLFSCCKKNKKQMFESKLESHIHEHISNHQMVDELSLHKALRSVAVEGGKDVESDRIKTMNRKRINKYMDLLADEHPNPDKFSGTCSYDFRLAYEYKKFYINSITQADINIKKMEASLIKRDPTRKLSDADKGQMMITITPPKASRTLKDSQFKQGSSKDPLLPVVAPITQPEPVQMSQTQAETNRQSK